MYQNPKRGRVKFKKRIISFKRSENQRISFQSLYDLIILYRRLPYKNFKTISVKITDIA
jgi:hypothetical protein